MADFPPLPNYSPIAKRLIIKSDEIETAPPDREDFLHSILCQVGMPRRKTDERSFERISSAVSIRLDAGALFDGKKYIEQPLPYGPKPRLVMVHVCSEAIRTGRRRVQVGDSMRQFLEHLGINQSAGKHGGMALFKKQLQALAACRMTLGFTKGDRVTTINTQPISRFEAWVKGDDKQRVLWPGMMELSQEFFESLENHAVPLDYRALAALSHSALDIDIYTWLANRLHRINAPNGVFVNWENLKDQFGQEYTGKNAAKDFKHEFKRALKQVHDVYPEARIEDERGGLRLRESKPPIAKTKVTVAKPLYIEKPKRERFLKSATIETFRDRYKNQRLDVYACKAAFDVWLESPNIEQPKHYDAAFLGFAEKWAKGKS